MSTEARFTCRTLPLSRLQPAPYNPRVPLRPGDDAYRRLERSLDEFGLVQPLVWNERTGHVVGGNQRLEILRRLGATEVPVCVVSLPIEREKALNVTLNNAQLASDWDADRLVELLHELCELPDLDATLTGFDADDLRDLLLAPEPFGAGDSSPESADKADTTSDPNEADVVRVIIHVPADDWETVRPAIDQLAAAHRLELHVQLPTGRLRRDEG